MTGQISLAHVAGPLHQALAVIDDQTWLFEAGGDRRRPTGNDIRFFFDHGLEVVRVASDAGQQISIDGLLRRLDEEAARHDALSAMLAGMDPDIDAALRRRMLRRAERHLQQKATHDFVARRLLRPTSAQEWDVQGAVEICAEFALAQAGRLFGILGGATLIGLEDEIYAWATGEGAGSSVAAAVVLAKARETGLVAAIAVASEDGTGNSLRNLIFEAKPAGWDPRLVAHLAARAAARVGAPLPMKVAVAALPEHEEGERPEGAAALRLFLAAELQRHRDNARRRPGGRRAGDKQRPLTRRRPDAFESTQNQVAWIVRRIVAGPAAGAWAEIEALCRRQLREGTPEDLAKSLTNIATQLRDADSSLEHRANPDGTDGLRSVLLELAAMCAPRDPFIGTERAEGWRQAGRLDEALAGYDAVVAAFPDNVVARTGRAETLRALGRLDEALAAYDAAIAAFPRDVYARNGRAETLRALGRLDEALAAYDAAVAAFPLSLVARNGRAGILLDLEKPADVLRALASVPDIPRRREDWVAAHIRCMAELFTTGPTGEAEKRLARLEAACAFAAQRRYFATALAVVRLALRRPQARAAVEDLARSALLPREDRAAVHLLVASAAAADGDVAAARLNIDKAGELVPYEVFQQRRLRQEIERRYGLRGSAALTSSTDRRNSEQRLFRLSCAVTTEMARRAA